MQATTIINKLSLEPSCAHECRWHNTTSKLQIKMMCTKHSYIITEIYLPPCIGDCLLDWLVTAKDKQLVCGGPPYLKLEIHYQHQCSLVCGGPPYLKLETHYQYQCSICKSVGWEQKTIKIIYSNQDQIYPAYKWKTDSK